MTRPFLDAVAARCSALPLTKTLFVLPTRRAATFLRRSLAAAGSEDTVHTCTPDTLATLVTGLTAATPTEALTALYRCYRRLVPGAETLEAFLDWGDALLADLDAMCRCGVDFKALPPADTLKGFSGGERLARLWDTLPALAEGLRSDLAAEMKATPGMLVRAAADKAGAMRAGEPLVRYRKVILVGLGVLDDAQERLLRRLQEEGRTLFFWDCDGEAVTDDGNAAARKMAQQMRLFPQAEAFSCPARPFPQQRWKVVRAASVTGAGQVVADAVGEALAGGAAEEDVAVVMPDGRLLAPTLAMLPDAAGAVNVTMGLPVEGSAAAATLLAVEHMIRDMRRKDGKVLLHHADVTALAGGSLVRRAFPEESAAIVAAVRGDGLVRVDRDRLTAVSGAAALLFDGLDGDMAAYLQRLTEALQGTAPAADREALALYHAAAADLAAVLPEDTPFTTWMRLFRKMTDKATTPFEGEPLRGVQVMGLMETRALDFAHVVIAGAQEGVLPATGGMATLLPAALRRSLGLPDEDLHDGIAAYNFWRSVCRADDVTVVVNLGQGAMGAAEESRYVKQLRYLYGVEPQEETAAWDAAAAAPAATAVAKDAAVMQALETLFCGDDARGAFSATSINTYLDCGVRFYFAHVLGVKERKDVVEDIDAALAGTVYHAVMERLYRPHRGRTLDAAAIAAMDDGAALLAAAREEAAREGVNVGEGRAAVLTAAVARMASLTLAADKAAAPLTIDGTETALSRRLRLDGGRTVRIYGKADRLDESGGRRRVVDYKTGAVKGRDDVSDAARCFDRTLGDRRPDIALQLYLYAWLAGDGRQPCVYSVRSLAKETPKAHLLPEGGEAAFTALLAETIGEIFDRDVPFTPTDDTERCKNCPFRTACARD